MKKLLIILFALGLISSANATMSLASSAGDTLQVGETSMIGIYNDSATINAGLQVYVIINEADMSEGSWTGGNNTYSPPNPAQGYNTRVGYYAGYGDIWYFTFDPSIEPWGTGVVADYEFQCDAVGDVTITLMIDDAVTVLDTMTITQVIPEPMTIALLGLGALFFRKKRAV